MSEKAKIRVRVHRKKYDENGNIIPHRHEHRRSTKVYKHRNGRIAREDKIPFSFAAESVRTVNPDSLDTLTEDPPKKKSYMRLKRVRTKVNYVKYPEVKVNSDEEFPELRNKIVPHEISHYNRFICRQPFVSDSYSSTLTPKSHDTTPKVETTVSDVTGPPRLSQSFTSFMNSSEATTRADTTQSNHAEDKTNKDKSHVCDNTSKDPFKYDAMKELPNLYPESKRGPLHKPDVEDSHSDFYKNYTPKLIENVPSTSKFIQLDQALDDDYGFQDELRRLQGNIHNPYVEAKIRRYHDSRSQSYSSKAEEDASNQFESAKSFSNSGRFKNADIASAGQIATCSAGQADFVEASAADPYAENYIELMSSNMMTKPHTGEQGSLNSTGKGTIEEYEYAYEEENEEEDDHDNATPAPQSPTMITVSELISASINSAQYVEVFDSQIGSTYIEVPLSSGSAKLLGLDNVGNDAKLVEEEEVLEECVK